MYLACLLSGVVVETLAYTRGLHFMPHVTEKSPRGINRNLLGLADDPASDPPPPKKSISSLTCSGLKAR
jgi:hypothetical protein